MRCARGGRVGMVRWRCVDAIGDGELEGCARVMDPVPFLLIEGFEGLEEGYGRVGALVRGRGLRRSGEGMVRGRGTVLHVVWRGGGK